MSIYIREGGEVRRPSVEVGIDANHFNPSDIAHAMETLDSRRTKDQMLVINGTVGYVGIVGAFEGASDADRAALTSSVELEQLGQHQDQHLLG